MKSKLFHINIADKKMLFSENLLYSIVWIVIFLIPILNSALTAGEYNMHNILMSWLKIAPYFIIFVINNTFVARRLLLRKHYLAYTIAVVALLCLVFVSAELYQQYIAGTPPDSNDLTESIPRHKASLTDLRWYWNMLLGLFMLGMHDGIIFIYKSISDERRMEVLKRQNLQAEMTYLKYQINPHFFMNTLNNIHALIDIDTDRAKECVIELSKMMRYVLYESGAHELSLLNELKFVDNYINLMRIRYTSSVDIDFKKPTRGISNIFIPPLLFIVFVENAFKHGISYSKPSFIHINVKCTDGKVIFAIENSNHASLSKNNTGGIGLENVRKRLGFIYKSSYSLDIDTSNPDIYRTVLTIPVTK